MVVSQLSSVDREKLDVFNVQIQLGCFVSTENSV